MTGDLFQGKSTLVKNCLKKIKVDYKGYFSVPIIDKNKRVGFGLQKAGEKKIDIFAHINLESGLRLEKYFYITKPFVDICFYLKKCLAQSPPLLVIDEIGIMEKDVPHFQEIIIDILKSKIPTLLTVQKRAQYLLDPLENRKDTIIYNLEEESGNQLELQIITHLQKLINK